MTSRPIPLRLAVSALAIVLLVIPAPAGAQEDAATKRPMTTDDALDMVDVSPEAISPDGNWVLYSKRKLDWDDNEYDTEIWIAAADGSES